MQPSPVADPHAELPFPSEHVSDCLTLHFDPIDPPGLTGFGPTNGRSLNLGPAVRLDT